MSAEPIMGVYDFASPGSSIELHRGLGEIDSGLTESFRIWMPMRGGLRLRWETTNDRVHVPMRSSTLTIDHPYLGSVVVPIGVLHTDGWGIVSGTAEAGDGGALSRVVTHWVNLPAMMPTEHVEPEKSFGRRRWSVEAAGWALTLDSRPDLNEVLRAASQASEEYVLTHVGDLRRTDGRTFDSRTAADVVLAFQWAMSFALGRWVGPALPVGFDQMGRRVWEQWTPWRCDTLSGYESWWNPNTADDLRDFVASFVAVYLDPEQQRYIHHVAAHVITANHRGTTSEGRVMLAQAGLELMAWLNFGLSGPKLTEKEFRTEKPAKLLRKLLREARIPLDVPTDLESLYKFARAKNWDGPRAAVEVRNLLTHPKDPKDLYQGDLLVWEGAQLFLEYAELLLLHRLDYRGRFRRRYPPGRWAGASEPVPWANDDSP